MVLQIDVWSDIACPWCWVGKRHLERALAEVDEPYRLTWRAFELDPSAPRTVADSSVTYAERLAKKYRVPIAQGQSMIDRMTQTGRGVGIDFRFDRVQPTNTFDAHRLLCWAAGTDEQDALKETLFKAYMTDGELVGDHAVLVARAASVGLDADAAQAVLDSDDFAAEVRAEQTQARQIGVQGVPFFVLGQKYAISGAQPPSVLAGALRRAAEDSAALIEVGGEAEVCGLDGCAVPEAS